MTAPANKAPATAWGGLHRAFIAAWFFSLLFYFMQYAVHSTPRVTIPELTAAISLPALGASSLPGCGDYASAPRLASAQAPP